MATLSRNRPQVAQTTSAATARLTAGSIQARPVAQMTRPATTTPADTAASAAMCRKAPRMLMSSLEPLTNSHAVSPFTRMPMAATTITVTPATGSGWMRRRIASQITAPMAISRNTALNRAARIEEPRIP